MVKASASRAEDPGFDSRLRRDLFGGGGGGGGGVDLKVGQALGIIGSALELIGPVSAYSDWVRWKV